MFNVGELEKQYQTDPAFNKAVNLFRQLIEQYGFLPSELRQVAFFAEWMIQMHSVEQVVRSQEEWRALAEMRMTMKNLLLKDHEELARRMGL